MPQPHQLPLLLSLAMLGACGEQAALTVDEGTGTTPTLPEPRETLLPTVNIAPALGWPDGQKPHSAPGTQVGRFASGLDHPRWLYVLPNGDVLVAESNAPKKPQIGGPRDWIMALVMKRAGAGVASADRISLLRDQDGDGIAEQRTTFISGINSPFGMALVGEDFYVATTDALLRFHYRTGQTRIDGPPEKIIDLPGGPINRHWTKNVIASPDGEKLYVTVGSNSNIGESGMENEKGRAAIWEVERSSGEHRIFATGLRNPNGLAWEPASGKLWTAVNERDGIGSDLVPDYITSVREEGFYGWPYSYFGQHVDERVQPQRPDLVKRALAPDYALGPHTASLGIAFAQGNRLPEPFQHGLFVGQHGSWNRKPHSGYKVIFVPFRNGQPSGQPVDLLTGFLDDEEKALGRPVGVIQDKQGALLVADDVGNIIWRVTSAP